MVKVASSENFIHHFSFFNFMKTAWSRTLGKCHFSPGEVASENWRDQVRFLRSKGGSKDFFKLERGDHLYFLKETKYFVKHFRFLRKGLSDATRGRKLQWDLVNVNQCKNVQLHSRFDVDFS